MSSETESTEVAAVEADVPTAEDTVTASATSGTRRLQTVMFTDIKGFSAMMSADEQTTVELVLEHRETVRARLAEFGGVEHETIGDAFLTLFDSPVNAAECAIAIQKDFAKRNEDRPINRQVWLRIGLHLGDIIHREGGIYGDGVNAAARIEGCAEAGGVCLSEQVRLMIGGRVKVETQLLEDVDLKGISNPPPVYRMVLDTERGLTGTERAAKSVRYGKQLVMATAGLIAVVGIALALNGTRSEAEDAAGADAAHSALRAPAPAPVAQPAKPDPAAIAAKAAADRAEAAVKQAKLAQKRVEAMSEKMHAAVKAKMTAAMKAKGKERVRLLEEALALDPDNAALAQLVMSAKAEVKRHHVRPARKRTHHAKKKPTPKPVVKAPEGIKPRVVED
ncbi:MAG: adenylate/guanylate cyclase domain-containing protein [Myxococcales bacterium]|nr:adenylate/guanylate cyclase domain-containing protein [Myxococcales bacterium]